MANIPEIDIRQILRARVRNPQIPQIKYTMLGAPPGLVMDPSTSRVTGSISLSASGDYLTTIQVANAHGGDFEAETFTWHVESAELDLSNIKDGSTVLYWVEVSHADVLGAPKTYIWAPADIVDDADYYGGYKEPRIIGFGDVTRGLSDERGLYETSEFNFVVADTDRLIRKTLDSRVAKHWQNRMVVGRIIDDVSRRSKTLPYVFARGVVRSFRPLGPLHFEFTAKDFLASSLSAGNVEKEIPNNEFSTTDYSNLPSGVAGQKVPIIYGPMTDEAVRIGTISGIQDNDNSSYVIVGAPGTTTYLYTITGIGLQNGPDPENQAQDNDHRQEFVWGQVLVDNAPSPSEWSTSRYVRLTWNNVGAGQQAEWWGGDPQQGTPGGVGYRIYGRVVGEPGKLLHGTRVNQSNNLWNDDNRVSRTPTSTAPVQNNVIFDGDPNGPEGTQIYVDTGKGVVPTVYVGRYDFSGTAFHKFVVCCHAIKRITSWYLGGIRQKVAPANELDNDLQTILVPGYAAWEDRLGSPQTYQDHNGRRYTEIWIKASDAGEAMARGAIDGTAPLTVNVEGIESAGDGTGALLEKLADIYKHFVVNFGFQDWQGGNWLQAPEWEIGLDFAAQAKINLASFDEMRDVHDRRIAGGYKGAIMFGAPTSAAPNLREAMAQLNISCDCKSGFDRHSRFFVKCFDESIATIDEATLFTQQHDIKRGEFAMDMQVDKVENEVNYVFARRYATTSVQTSTGGYQAADWLGEGTESDAETIELLKETKRGPRLELWGVRDATIAKDIAMRRLLYYKQPPTPVNLTTTLKGLGEEIGDTIKVDSIEGGGTIGWSGRPLWIHRQIVNPQRLDVKFEAVDVWRLFSTAFILGDETAIAATWGAASSGDKLRGYLCDATTKQFSNGEDGKRLR